MVKVGDRLAVDCVLVGDLYPCWFGVELWAEGKIIESVFLALLQYRCLGITGIKKALLESRLIFRLTFVKESTVCFPTLAQLLHLRLVIFSFGIRRRFFWEELILLKLSFGRFRLLFCLEIFEHGWRVVGLFPLVSSDFLRRYIRLYE